MIHLTKLRAKIAHAMHAVSQYPGNHKTLMIRILLVALLVVAPLFMPRIHQAQSVCAPSGAASGCFVPPLRDVVFMIDASGSVEQRGQTYNIQVEGVRRALSDPTVIPRDGSMTVTVIIFTEVPQVVVPFTEVTSEAVAQQLAATVAGLKCNDIHSHAFPCPFGATKYAPSIEVADITLRLGRNTNLKPGVSRVMILSSDGLTNDLDNAIKQLEFARSDSSKIQIPMELDFIVVGENQDSPDFATALDTANQLVAPQPANDLPGESFLILADSSNVEGASPDDPNIAKQANNFAEITRTILRGPVPVIQPVVDSEIDTAPGTPIGKEGTISLRQAIELANCNGGATTISFAASVREKTTQLLSPLPAITVPDVTIDGCTGNNCAPALTIDGGGQISDGIVIRSNRVTVRGMKITNFTEAGVLIAPQCPQDVTGHNRIEQNLISGSPTAILVLGAASQGAAPVTENVQNTLTRNTISRPTPAAGAPVTALIDLGGDGPTANDDGDIDSGPNTLLNFPDSMMVTAQDATVTVMGKLNTPPPGGATVEIFGVTSFRLVNDRVVADGVTFLGQTTANATGDFVATGLPASPTGIYTATVTDLPNSNPADQSANTSELMIDSVSTPLPRPSASFTATVDFGNVTLNTPTTKPVTINNTGSAPLTVTGCTIGRCPDTASDNRDRFTVANCPTAKINPGQTATINVTFTAAACGPASACLLLQTDDPKQPQVAVTLTATVSSPAHLVVQGGVTQLKFKRQPPRGAPSANPTTRTFTVTNTGCDSITLTSATFTRGGQIDDSGIFKIAPLGSGPVTIQGGGSQVFTVSFNPVIPPVASGTARLRDLLPDSINDTLTIGPVTLTVIGGVKPRARFIDPSNPNAAPAISLCKSGDEFIVTFSAYDANTNVNRAVYQFKDSAGSNVGSPLTVDNIAAILQQEGIQKGQSFTLTQRFSGANDNKRVATVEVTIFDSESSDTLTSSALGSNCSGVSLQSRSSGSGIVVSPVRKSLPARRKRAGL